MLGGDGSDAERLPERRGSGMRVGRGSGMRVRTSDAYLSFCNMHRTFKKDDAGCLIGWSPKICFCSCILLLRSSFFNGLKNAVGARAPALCCLSLWGEVMAGIIMEGAS